jgi:hypothetical protein
MMQIIDFACYPWFAWSAGTASEASSFAADVILINKKNEPVAFDLSAGLIARISDDRALRALFERLRNLSAFYRCVWPTRREGLIVENLLKGIALASASHSQRTACAYEILEAIARAPVAPSGSELTGWLELSHDTLRHLPAPIAQDEIVREQVRSICSAARWSWTHGDLTGENIILTDDGPQMIDFDKARIAPAFTDSLILFVMEARMRRYDLFLRFIAGDFDTQLSKLSCFVDGTPTSPSRIAAFVATIGWLRICEPTATNEVKSYVNLWTRLAIPHPMIRNKRLHQS